MVRRHCGLGVAEFRALPWDEQEIIREGLREEFSVERWRAAVRTVVPEEPPSLAEMYAEDESSATASSLETLSGLGMKVRKV
jgi:hypothetical protein